MKILLTGGSSFTGLWFARSLNARGHAVVAPLKGTGYSGLRGIRVTELKKVAEVIDDCPFGSARFLDLVAAERWDLLCQHAARSGDYRSADFDVLAAVAENTHNMATVLKAMLKQGLVGVLATGSIFEQDEGIGGERIRAFSPYGLSKGLTWQFYRFLSETLGFKLAKFTIPNPFGPFEEPRFCTYLVRSWFNGDVPTVRTPLYVRDNVHVDLLAAAYAAFAEQLTLPGSVSKLNPSFYIESQGAFANRFASEMAPRLGLACPFVLLDQSEFGEPMVRINTDRLVGTDFGWSERLAWDNEAAFYNDSKDTLMCGQDIIRRPIT
jgi:nucleoside-diphosphate-sugar epimerase